MPPSSTPDAPSMSMLQMNDIFFYIMFGGHTDFVGMLVLEMLANIKKVGHEQVFAVGSTAWPRIGIPVIWLGYFWQKRPTFCQKVAKETYKI